MLLPNSKRPLNESEMHYELKQIAKYILKRKGCSIIGEEVIVGSSHYLWEEYKNIFNKNTVNKSIIDVIGLKTNTSYWYHLDWRTNEYKYNKPIFQSIGMEAKATLEDFKNGFCCNPERVYIIAPKSTIPIELIPKNIGLIEVDLDNYKILYTSDGFIFEGIEEIIRARARVDTVFIDTNSKPKENIRYQTWCEDIMRTIAYRHTNDDLFKNNKIPIHSKKWSGNK